jgi:hypothetical protein
MDMIEELLKPHGLKYEDLNILEQETLETWMGALSKKQLTVESIRQAISNMKEAVEHELILEPEFNYILLFKIPNRKQIFLKARLKNYLLLEAFLLSPEKAKKALEQAITGLTNKK